jgi:three-Cys-motif partner protein
MLFDQIGNWSEIKLEIIRKYAAAYSTILSKQRGLHHVYIDAFAGPGVHIAKSTGKFVRGSPLNALNLKPPFLTYYLIDIEEDKISALRSHVGGRADVHLLAGDCNDILLETVFPQVQYQDFRRGLCLLDPYGLHLDWTVIAKAGGMGSIEIFLNFPVADMNRNVLWAHPERVDPSDMARMSRFWGDQSWKDIAYSTESTLFGDSVEVKTGTNKTIAQAFRDRLRTAGEFRYVADPLPMKNSKGAIVYYLFFASQNQTGHSIVRDIFRKHR